MLIKTSKTTFNNDQQRSGKEKDLWLETLKESELFKRIANQKSCLTFGILECSIPLFIPQHQKEWGWFFTVKFVFPKELVSYGYG